MQFEITVSNTNKKSWSLSCRAWNQWNVSWDIGKKGSRLKKGNLPRTCGFVGSLRWELGRNEAPCLLICHMIDWWYQQGIYNFTHSIDHAEACFFKGHCTQVHRMIIVQEHRHPLTVAKIYSSPSLSFPKSAHFHCIALYRAERKHLFTFKIMMCP